MSLPVISVMVDSVLSLCIHLWGDIETLGTNWLFTTQNMDSEKIKWPASYWNNQSFAVSKWRFIKMSYTHIGSELSGHFGDNSSLKRNYFFGL